MLSAMQNENSPTKTSQLPSGSNGMTQENLSKTLEQQIRDAFPNLTDQDFAYQATDLFVVYSKELYDWLKKNYQFFGNCTFFTSQKNSGWNGAGKTCIDIPFQGKWKK
jgi:hypothetical protein